MKKIIMTMLAVLPMMALTAQKSTISGTLTGVADGVRIVVAEEQSGKLVPVDTLSLDAKGRFKLERKIVDPFFMALSLTINQSPMVHVMLMPKEKMTLDLEYHPVSNALSIVSTKGSENMAVYKEFNNMMVHATEHPEERMNMPNLMQQLLSDNASVLMSAFMVTYFESAFDQYATLYKQIRDSLITDYPDNLFVRQIDHKLRNSVVVGMDAPDIVMAGVDGKELRLSDLRGKVVLIDFWASWCRPCRMENPNVVRIYKKYRDRGFEIFSVSLDNNRDAWVNTIASDQLIWPNHVSDLRGWSNAAAKLYGVSSIPATVLVDPDGKVLARNLRGAALEQFLVEMFDKK